MAKRVSRRRPDNEGTVLKRTIKRKDGTTTLRYYARIFVGINPKTGRRSHKLGPLRTTYAEANKDRQRMVRQVEDTGETSLGTTVAEYLNQWLLHHSPDIAERTIREYKKDIRLHINLHLGKTALSDLTPMQLQRWQTRLYNQSPYVARSARACLNAALNQAVIWQILPANPLASVKPVRLPTRTYTIWTPDEVEHFMDNATDYPLYPFFYLLLSLGLRRGEGRGLMWSDFTGDQVHIQRTLSDDRNLSDPNFGPPKTKKSDRWLPVPEDLRDLLETHRQAQLERNHSNHLDLVFSTRVGTPITGSDLDEQFKTICKELKLPKIRIHDLRHTAASMWLRAGLDIRNVSERLGHSDANTTLRIYVHPSQEAIRRSAVPLRKLTKMLKESQ